MSKTDENIPLFNAVDYEAAFPVKPVPRAPTAAPAEVLTSAKAIALINAELEKIAVGTSKMTPHAVQVRKGSTPFLAALRTFEVVPELLQAVALIEVGRQDFGHTFGDFVEKLVRPLFGRK
jgi:hypothetical protein